MPAPAVAVTVTSLSVMLRVLPEMALMPPFPFRLTVLPLKLWASLLLPLNARPPSLVAVTLASTALKLSPGSMAAPLPAVTVSSPRVTRISREE